MTHVVVVLIKEGFRFVQFENDMPSHQNSYDAIEKNLILVLGQLYGAITLSLYVKAVTMNFVINHCLIFQNLPKRLK